MSIRDWPASERPRERLLELGASALSDAELLAVFIRSGTRKADALSLARELLTRYGSLRELLSADIRQLRNEAGLGLSKVAALKAAIELSRRFLAADLQRKASLSDPRRAGDFLKAKLHGLPYEAFIALFLDNQHRVIACDTLFTGSLASTEVHPREVVRRALSHNAAALIFAHNHPSGVAEPSRSDVQLTSRLVEALRLVDMRVLDHFVIGDGAPVSMAERGLL